MKSYDHKKIEKKWQKEWDAKKLYKTKDGGKKKMYVLDMFPYPSGDGLHVGHPKGYIATDIVSRHARMQGKSVLHPMGWDAFGLPAENYAIKNKVHPRKAVDKNVARYKQQLKMIGLDYDWGREINTTDPEFYKWTQWIFLKLYEKGLAYQSFEPINWCPSCQTGLANEDLEGNACERCGTIVEKRPMRQWVLKITDYAERLLQDLELLPHWQESIKESQRNWIGKSEGAEIIWKVCNEHGVETGESLVVFTTRTDTIPGVTYLVLAPESPLVAGLTTPEQRSKVEKYQAQTVQISDIDRQAGKDKSGVATGMFAKNPFNEAVVPLYVANYVLASYGTGVVMGMGGHDERDREFSLQHDIPVILTTEVPAEYSETTSLKVWTGAGEQINSGEGYDGLPNEEAAQKILEKLERDGVAVKKINYKIRDWVFSRQRYWGEPIPMIHCETCGVVPVPEKELPVKLPDVKQYEPTGTGESPLAAIEKWVNVKCPKCKGKAKRETNTMPQWAGSSWYWLRYMDPKNKKALVDKKKEKHWAPVDLYVGGAEHATRHLIYGRFWHKFLKDIKVVSTPEPFTRLISVGLIQAEDGRKMSKRYGNVINPDDIVATYGADTLRVYEMFMGPFSDAIAWKTASLIGARRFIERVWRLQEKIQPKADQSVDRELHKTIKKVGEDIANFKFNTAISQMMIFVNAAEEKGITKTQYASFIALIAPFAPHVAEELWRELGNKKSIHLGPWPKFDAKKLVADEVTIVVQINGKVRTQIVVPADSDEAMVRASAEEAAAKWLEGHTIRKVIFVANRLVNFVI